MSRIFITGDTHGDFERIEYFCNKAETSKDDLMIVLGDAGINYYGGKRDRHLKEYLQQLPITFLCIRGNHEMRPEDISNMEEKGVFLQDMPISGTVLYQPNYPDILYAKDGGSYNITINGEDRRVLTIGGAYSVDKQYRLSNGWHWFENEQLNKEEQVSVERDIVAQPHYDIVLTHTVPIQWEPVECFLPFIDQSTVDKTTESWLSHIEEQITYKKWFAGHYHVDKIVDDKVRLMFNDIIELK